jgi:hypothetical protein
MTSAPGFRGSGQVVGEEKIVLDHQDPATIEVPRALGHRLQS